MFPYKKFKWDQYYYDLETGDPHRFPYWQFAVHETINFIANIMTGIVMAFLLVVIIGTALSVAAERYPNQTFSVFQKAVCDYKK